MKKSELESELRIAIVLNASWNVFNFRLGLLRALEKEGHKIFVIAPVDAYSSRLGFPHFPITVEGRGRNPFQDIAFFWKLCQYYRELNPDIALHFTSKPNIYGTLAAAWRGIPSISNIAGLGTLFTKKSWATRVLLLMYRVSLRFPVRVFFQNPEDMKLFLESGLVSPGKADRVPGSGIDTERFRPCEDCPPNPKTIFLLASRLLREKGIEEFVEAARQLYNGAMPVEFHLLGFIDAGNSDSISRDQVDVWEREGVVQYLGETDHVEHFMKNADCIVLPSYYREGVPRVLLEAASMGKPIIAADNVGTREIVKDGVNGFLCCPKNAADLAEKMRIFLALSTQARKAMGGQGREMAVARFDEKIVIQKYLEVMRIARKDDP